MDISGIPNLDSRACKASKGPRSESIPGSMQFVRTSSSAGFFSKICTNSLRDTTLAEGMPHHAIPHREYQPPPPPPPPPHTKNMHSRGL
mgnify:CR=1 FL=1